MKITKLFFSTVVWSLLFTFSFAQDNWYKNAITGEGPIVKKELNLDDFNSIGLGVSADVYLTQNSRQKVVVEGQQNIIDNLETEVEDGSWNIGFEKNVRNHKTLNIYISLPTLKALAVAGSGDIYGETAFKNLGDLNVSISGSGNISLKGDARKTNLSIAGSGDIEMGDMRVSDCSVSIAGSGDCDIYVSGRLVVSIVGSGDVHYGGQPKVSTSIIGSGDVESRE